jgi:hypothetical protein
MRLDPAVEEHAGLAGLDRYLLNRNHDDPPTLNPNVFCAFAPPMSTREIHAWNYFGSDAP